MSGSVPIDLELTGASPEEIIDLARAAEAAGFARLWAPELTRSSTIPLAIAAAATDHIEVGTGVALAFTRSPFTLALEALDLDELSNGRFVLGLGAGVRRLNERWHNVVYDHPVRRMREMIAAVRELVATMPEEGPSRSEGRLVDVEVIGFRRPYPAPRREIPIWMAAMMPGMSRLAGQIADGVLDHPVTTPEWLNDRIRPEIAKGAERAERPMPQVAGALICAISRTDPAAARAAAACTVGFYASVRTYEELFSEEGFADRLPGIRRAFLTRDANQLAEAVGEHMVSRFAAAGTPDEVRARVASLGTSVDRIWATPPHHLQDAAASAGWQRSILTSLGR